MVEIHQRDPENIALLHQDYNELYSDYIDYGTLYYAQLAFEQEDYSVSHALFVKAMNRLMEYDGDKWYYINYGRYIGEWLERSNVELEKAESVGLGRRIISWLMIQVALLKPQWVIDSSLPSQ